MTSPLDKLTHELSKLPSIGGKTALRLALHILRQSPEYGRNLALAIQETLSVMRFCESCFHIADQKLCRICQNPNRHGDVLCVVEEVSDLLAIENTHSFRGRYHVLHGSLSPMDGIGPEHLKIDELQRRLENNSEIQEIILATNPNVNGDATALYLAKRLKMLPNVRVTKLASGIPVGSHIEFIDNHTLSRALEMRGVF